MTVHDCGAPRLAALTMRSLRATCTDGSIIAGGFAAGGLCLKPSVYLTPRVASGVQPYYRTDLATGKKRAEERARSLRGLGGRMYAEATGQVA